jgi:hypothetical protein
MAVRQWMVRSVVFNAVWTGNHILYPASSGGSAIGAGLYSKAQMLAGQTVAGYGKFQAFDFPTQTVFLWIADVTDVAAGAGWRIEAQNGTWSVVASFPDVKAGAINMLYPGDMSAADWGAVQTNMLAGAIDRINAVALNTITG